MFGDIFGNGENWRKMPFYLQREFPEELEKDLEFLLGLIEKRTGTDKYNELFIYAFKYLCNNPKQYDGASGDQELHVIKKTLPNGKEVYLRYDIPSIPHDVLDAVNFTYNEDRMKLNNSMFDKFNKDMSISEFNLHKRKLVGMWVVNKFRLWRKRKQPKISLAENDEKLYNIVYKLTNGNSKIDFKGWRKFIALLGTILTIIKFLFF